jgi:rRNA-processing protein FCF1
MFCNNLLEESTLERKEHKIRDAEEFGELIKEYIGNPSGSVKMIASYKLQNLWEAQVQRKSVCIYKLAQNTKFSKQVTNSLDRISANELVITDVSSKLTVKTIEEEWAQRFLDFATNGLDRIKQKELVPDTNFLIRRYATGMQRRLGEEKFSKLRFAIPSLTILEIEAIYNRAKKTHEALIELSKITTLKAKEEEEQAKAMFDMKQALIATKELMFLRNRGAYILTADIEPALKELSDIAGKGLTDRYIREEIRAATKHLAATDIKFVTCDLMNALSAVAEGLPTLYFSRVEPIDGKYSLSLDYSSCLNQLADLIVDTVTVFGEISFNWHPFGREVKSTLRGQWDSWTIEDLLNDRILEE